MLFEDTESHTNRSSTCNKYRSKSEDSESGMVRSTQWFGDPNQPLDPQGGWLIGLDSRPSKGSQLGRLSLWKAFCRMPFALLTGFRLLSV